MMSLRSWLALLMVYVLFLIMGGYTFRALESPTDCKNIMKDKAEKLRLGQDIALLRESLNPEQHQILDRVVSRVDINFQPLNLSNPLLNSILLGNGTLEDAEEKENICPNWNFYNSFFFSFTALTTIGFGHLAPATPEGRAVCIAYSLLGVPVNGILIGSLGAYFGSKLKKFKKDRPAGRSELGRIVVLTIQVCVYLIPGLICFIILPAIIFFYIEDWNYLDCIYFAFITLMTIGFGDFVAGRNAKVLSKLGNWKVVYEGALIVWIIFGLGYLFMIVTVITDGIRAPARKAVKRLAAAEKALMAKVLTEVLVMKTKQRTGEGSYPSDMCYAQSPIPNVDLTGDHPDTDNKVYSITNPRKHIDDNLVAQRQKGATRGDVGMDLPSTPDMEELLDELNHDTITSLHNFMQSARTVHRSLNLGSSNSSLTGGATSSVVSEGPYIQSHTSSITSRLRDSFFQRRPPMSNNASQNSVSAEDEVASLGRCASEDGTNQLSGTHGTWRKMFSRHSSLRSVSVPAYRHTITSRGVPSIRSNSMSLSEVLRDTTLEEFLQAIERVRVNEGLTDHNLHDPLLEIAERSSVTSETLMSSPPSPVKSLESQQRAAQDTQQQTDSVKNNSD